MPRGEGAFNKTSSLQRVCTRCASGPIGDEKHLNSENAEMQPSWDRWLPLFEGPDFMQDIMWQDDLSGVAKCVNVCLDNLSFSGGPSIGIRTSDQPGVAGKDVI